jgi:tRNA(fMet)-specific endonuclease VapC
LRTEALDVLEVVPFAPPADAVCAVIRAALEKAGRPIGANDLLIAAHAVSLGCTLVTDKQRDFARIEGLSAENWLR